MPIYSYTCKDCNHSFDQMHSIADMANGVCPECNSTQTCQEVTVCGINGQGLPGHEMKWEKTKYSQENIKAMIEEQRQSRL